jgi:hypothetical protein
LSLGSFESVTGKTPAETETSGGNSNMSRFTALSLSFAAAVSAAVSVLVAAPAAAEAANGPNLSVSVTPPPATNVYAAGRYNLTVANVGNRDALNVRVVINLPSSQTSPSVSTMGTLGARSVGCNVSGLVTDLQHQQDPRGPQRAAVLRHDLPGHDVVAGHAGGRLEQPRGSEPGQQHRDDHAEPAHVRDGHPGRHRRQRWPDLTADIDHCTGRDLVSFYQCVITPTSISSHQHIFNADNTISFAFPDYAGVWSQNPGLNELSFSYTEGPDTVLDFVGYGVDGTNCFEGIVNFYPASVYNSAYSVCLQ